MSPAYRLRSLVFVLLLMGVSACNTTTPIVKNESTQGRSVASIVASMTLAEKVGQMTQAERRFLICENDIRDYHLGSILSGGGSDPSPNEVDTWANMVDRYQALAAQTRFGIPLLYGIDAVHGHNNVVGATLFPHNIGLGATGNTDLVRDLAHMTAREVRATGINWTFAPCVTNARDERWGRSYESFGEDPALITRLGRAQIEGFQGQDLSAPDAIAACTKHYLGDGAPTWSTGEDGMIDRGDAQIDESELRALHLPPYRAAIEAGTATIMASYNSWKGEKLHGQSYLLNDLLKGELGFKGFVVSDWGGIDELPGSYKQDVIQSINAGIDMVMVPGNIRQGKPGYRKFIKVLTAAVNEGSVPMSRIDDAVTRILTVKKRMGLLDNPFVNDRELVNSVGSTEHRELARQAVRESLVLLKNDGILPLDKKISSLVVAGKGADDMGMQCGGWSISWQGKMGDIITGTTILEGIQEAVSPQTTVVLSEDGGNTASADAVIVVVGETPYAEMHGDRSDLGLSPQDRQVIENVKDSGTPFVIVLLSGRPMIVTDILKDSHAFLAAWLPGTEGDGVSEVLFGDFPPSGKLPVSWPKSMNQIPVNIGDENYKPLFPVGFGLSY